MEGDSAQRRHARFVPATISKSFIQTKEAALTDAYDGWLARIICYAFSVSYQALTTDVNRATAETAEMQAHQEGLAPLAQWVKGVMDRVLSQCLGWPDLEFAWATEADIDPLTQAQVNQIYLTTGVLTAAEVRAGLGLVPAPSATGVTKFNHNHDERGRLSTGDGAAAAGTASATALGVPGSDVASVAARVVAGARAVASTVMAGAEVVADAIGAAAGTAAVGATAAASVLLIPANAGQVSEGTLPDHPDISYRVAEGQLTIIRTDADGNKIVLFDGVPDFNGDYRTKDGILIGHQQGNGAALDSAALLAVKPGGVQRVTLQPPQQPLAMTTAPGCAPIRGRIDQGTSLRIRSYIRRRSRAYRRGKA